MKNCDAIVLGAGPAGLSSALYLTRAGLKTVLVEKHTAGGQVLSTSDIENYLGFPKGVKGYELADLFSNHLDEYPVERVRGDVVKIESDTIDSKWQHKVYLENNETITASTVIIATGATHRKLGINDEDLFAGKGVSYCAICDGNFYRNLDVAVVGGGNSALEEALYLARIVNKVYLIHRRDAFRADKIYLDKILDMPEKIELVTKYVVESLKGNPNLTTINVKHVETGEIKALSAEGIFIYVGNVPNSAFVPEAIKNEQGFLLTDAEMCTSISGIFAAGDIRQKACRQVCTAVGDGATAATSAINYLEHL